MKPPNELTISIPASIASLRDLDLIEKVILARIHEPITNHPAFRLDQNLLIGAKIDFLAGTGMTLLRRQPDGSWRFAQGINNSVLAPGR